MILLGAALLMALLAALLAGAVSGLTGFGLALISVPLLLLVYDPVTAVALIAILSVFVNAVVVWDSWRFAGRGSCSPCSSRPLSASSPGRRSCRSSTQNTFGSESGP